MRKTALALAAVIGLTPLAATPAQATTCILGVCIGGDIRHDSDDGYDDPIIVFCDWSDAYPVDWSKDSRVAEGSSSTSDCGTDTDVIWVRADEEIWCDFPVSPYTEHRYLKVFDAQGPHKIEDNWSEDCVVQRD